MKLFSLYVAVIVNRFISMRLVIIINELRHKWNNSVLQTRYYDVCPFNLSIDFGAHFDLMHAAVLVRGTINEYNDLQCTR